MTLTPLESGLSAIDQFACDDDRTQLIATKCRALLRGYAQRWSDSIFIPREVERVASADLTNPATGRKSKDLKIAGKLDVLAVHQTCASDRKLVLIDHKTTSDDITDPASAYWRQLVVESQPSHYMLLKWLNGLKIDMACWDVLHKPSINPRQLRTKAEKTFVVANREYFGRKMSDDVVAWLQTNDRENLEMYEARLLHDCTVERPNYYFQRRTIPRLDSEILEYAEELWDSGQLIIEARRKDRWPKHPGSCMNYGTPCRFLGICSNQDNPESANWKKRDCFHEELGTQFDHNTLTYSSIRTFQSCPRKFYFTYHLGIERIEEEEREALLFGTIWHVGLQGFWEPLIPVENENGNSNTCGVNSIPDSGTAKENVSW